MQRRVPIQRRLRRMFLTISFIPLVAILLIYTISQAATIKNTNSELNEEQIENLQNDLNNLLKEAFQIGKTISEDDDIITALSFHFDTDKERYATEVEIDNKLSYISGYFDPRVQVYVIAENGAVFKNNAYSIKSEKLSDTDWYKEVLDTDGEKWFPVFKESRVVKDYGKMYIALGMPVFAENNTSPAGVLLVETEVQDVFPRMEDEGELYYIINPNYDMKITNGTVEMFENDIISVFGKNKSISFEMYEEIPEGIEHTLGAITYWRDNFSHSGILTTNGYEVCYATMDINNWIIVKCTPMLRQYLPIAHFIVMVVVLMLGMTVILLYISDQFSNSFTIPILSLEHSASLVGKGNLDVTLKKDRDDEIGDLTDQFNWMVSHIKSLLNRIIEEQNIKRKYELLLLQAQINPHFLYNTLDSMVWLIRMHKNEDAEMMLESLITFFKTGLNKGDDLLQISQEIKNVESYIKIQSCRYKSKLSYDIKMDESVGNFIVPKLILQPLVENSIYHGIKGKDGSGHIIIECRKDKNSVRFIVSDDGIGMNEEERTRLLQQIRKEDVKNRDSYGIINVMERLKMCFHENVNVSIESSPGRGTIVEITIDVKEQENVQSCYSR